MYQRIANGKVISVKDGNMPYIYVGTDAGKPTPGIGDFASCSDTGKEYRCYVNGIWTLTNSPCSEEYKDHECTIGNIMDTTTTGNSTATPGADHSMALTSGTGVLGKATFFSNITYLGSNYFEINFKIKSVTIGATTWRLTQIGMIDTSVGDAGCSFYSSDGAWYCETSQNGILSEQTSISAVVAGDILTIIGRNTQFLYFVNGIIVATHTSYDISAMTLTPLVSVRTDGGATVSSGVSIDYIGWKILI